MRRKAFATLTFKTEVPVVPEYIHGPNLVEDRTCDTKDKQDEEKHQYLCVGKFVHG